MNEKSIFKAARIISDLDDRDEFLRFACEGDADLLARIKELLCHDTEDTDFLDSPFVEIGQMQDHEESDPIGEMIGPYKLLQKIGEGGMGTVYMAEQQEQVTRRVALKLIKPGMDSRQVITRFEAERQALAIMDHPNIARVLDVGTTALGRPYFVMELVKGMPITEYCDEHRLDVNKRLELFTSVCSAVQHAHQKGIIHRDIKPSNVLVAEYDDRAIPKIIDFGLAKALNQRLTEKTMFTQMGQVVGTLEYMSPEQSKLNQLDVDTRSDIYSLGVLLYELLTGSPPFDRERLRSAAFDEVLRIIREEDPPKPSHRLSSSESRASVASDRATAATKLGKLVRGELDLIVMKAMEKNRSRRYDSANEIRADIQRYLEGVPILAAPPSLLYRTRKFVRRRPALVGIASASAFVAIIVSLFVYSNNQTNKHERMMAAIDTLEATRGDGVPIALMMLEQYPKDWVKKELVARSESETKRDSLTLAYGLASYRHHRFSPMIAAIEDPNTTSDETANLVKALSTDKPGAIDMLKRRALVAGEKLDWRTKARIATLALFLNETSVAAEMLRAGPEELGQPFDPIERTVFIREFAAWAGSVGPLAEVLSGSENPALQSGICLSLGSVPNPGLEAKEKWRPVLAQWYETTPSSGTHCATSWVMSRWNLEPPATRPSTTPLSGRNWWIEPNGIRFVKIYSGVVNRENGPLAIADDHWLSDSEITVGQFRQFMADDLYHANQPELKPNWVDPIVLDRADSTDLPVHGVSWYDAVLFCNWLSWKLGMEKCYEIRKTNSDSIPYIVNWRAELNGIRLPTKAEWEFACRALTTTRFSFGNNDQDFSDYGWFSVNSNSRAQPVRQKLCNAWGLFDMHGNTEEWCWDWNSSGSERLNRGGSWTSTSGGCRLSFDQRSRPATFHSGLLGFRVAQGVLNPSSVETMERAAAEAEAFNNMIQVCQSVHLYYDVHQSLPFKQGVLESDLSWRVAVLPYFELASENKWELDGDIPDVFKTYKGKISCIKLKEPPLRLGDIPDGLSTTIALIEDPNDRMTPWTTPNGVTPEQAADFISNLEDGDSLIVAYYDGSVSRLTNKVSREDVIALCTPAGGEVVERK